VSDEHSDNDQSDIVRDGPDCRGTLRRLRTLRTAIDVGIADAEPGRSEPLTDELLRDIADKGRQLVESRKPKST
jgi:hypothetical protein